MLQQTQVAVVIPYYERFLQRFPDVATLARAEEGEVLRLWAGLGYYSRARNLLRAAKMIQAEHGRFPEEFDAVRALPGIGRYTAGAICSIALHQPYPAVDGNVKRILARLYAVEGGASEGFFHKRALALLPGSRDVAAFNQALMDLGALVCTPRQPRCDRCPVAGCCAAFRLGRQDDLPARKAARAPEALDLVLLVLERGGEVLLTAAGAPGFIPGRWGLPCRIAAAGEAPEEVAAKLCLDSVGEAVALRPRKGFRHGITRHRVTAHLFHGMWDGAAPRSVEEGWRWAPWDEAGGEVTSSLFRKALRNCG
jgi:A/G-specific adenine glycosylase